MHIAYILYITRFAYYNIYLENEAPFSLLSEAASGNLDSLKTLSAILNAYTFQLPGLVCIS